MDSGASGSDLIGRTLAVVVAETAAGAAVAAVYDFGRILVVIIDVTLAGARLSSPGADNGQRQVAKANTTTGGRPLHRPAAVDVVAFVWRI